jgi:hydroxyacylglutathione hydrolase
MNIQTIIVGSIKTNCYLISDKNNCFLIDPGGDAELIIDKLKIDNLQLDFILLTHGHFDHILALKELALAYPTAKICVSPKDGLMVSHLSSQAAMFGFRASDLNLNYAELKDGQEIEFAGQNIKVIETPGHTPGSVCYLMGNTLFSGDTLFYRSVGRTDLPGSSSAQLSESLIKLSKLLEATKVLPGHGPRTTIGQEKKRGYLRTL